jgi:hypothetical protein
MANYVTNFLQTEKETKIPEEMVILFKENNEYIDSYEKTSIDRKTTQIDATCNCQFQEEFINKVIELSKKYPKEKFKLAFTYEVEDHCKHHYKLSAGELKFSHYEPIYWEISNEYIPVLPHKEQQDLINDGLNYLKKFDAITEDGIVKFCPYKTTIEVYNEEFKILIEKDQMYYQIKEVYKKELKPTWEKYDPHGLPF